MLNDSELEARRKKAEQKIKKILLEERLDALISSSLPPTKKPKLFAGTIWAYHKKKNLIIYPSEGGASVYDLQPWEASAHLLHEIAHAKFSGALTDVMEVPEPRKAYATLLNCLEDLRIERNLMRVYPGTKDGFRYIAAEEQKLIDEEHLKLLPNQLSFLANLRQHEWGYKVLFKDKRLEDLFLDSLFLVKEAITKKTTQALHAFIKTKLWGQYKKILEEYDSQTITQELPPESGTSQSQLEGVGDSAGGSLNSEQEKTRQKYKEALGDKIIEMKDIVSEMMRQSGKTQGDKNTEKTLGHEIARQMKKSAGEDDEQLTSKPDVEHNILHEDYKSYEELYADIERYIPFFARKLISILKDNKQHRRGGAFRTGELNTQRLYKWKCKSDKLFTQKLLKSHKEYSVCLLIDESGSMGGASILNAARGAVLLAEVLDHAGIPFEIRGFNKAEYVYKTYDRDFSWTVKRNLQAIIPNTSSSGGGYTNDAFAINWATDALKHREGEKILMVLSDGKPNPSNRLIPVDYWPKVPANFRYYTDFELGSEILKAEHHARVIGVGIGHRGAEKSYPHHVDCTDISELPRLVLEMIRNSIKRG